MFSKPFIVLFAAIGYSSLCIVNAAPTNYAAAIPNDNAQAINVRNHLRFYQANELMRTHRMARRKRQYGLV